MDRYQRIESERRSKGELRSTGVLAIYKYMCASYIRMDIDIGRYMCLLHIYTATIYIWIDTEGSRTSAALRANYALLVCYYMYIDVG